MRDSCTCLSSGLNPDFTKVPTELRRTCTGEVSRVSRHTGGSIPAGQSKGAWMVLIILTASTNETRWARTVIAIASIGTGSTILTWSGGT